MSIASMAAGRPRALMHHQMSLARAGKKMQCRQRVRASGPFSCTHAACRVAPLLVLLLGGVLLQQVVLLLLEPGLLQPRDLLLLGGRLLLLVGLSAGL